MVTDFFDRPVQCYHPALDGRWFPAIVVKVAEDKVVIFNLNYLIDAGVSGVPGSGFPYTPKSGVKFEHTDNELKMWDRGAYLYRFVLSKDVQELYEKNKQYLQTLESMKERAAEEFG